MPIRRTLTAVSLAAAVALAGCGSGDDSTNDAANTDSATTGSPDTAAPTEGAASQMPEPDLEDVPDVVAEVNGEEITRDQFVQSYEAQFQQSMMSQQGAGGELDQDQLKQQVADLLVDNRLLTQAAQEADIETTDQNVNDTLTDIAERNGLGSADEVISALEEQGLSEEQIREDAATQYQLNTFIEQETDVEAPTEAELREQYDTLVEQQGGDQGSSGSQSQIPPFEEVRDQLEDQATAQEESAAVDTIVEDLRADADVTIHLGE